MVHCNRPLFPIASVPVNARVRERSSSRLSGGEAHDYTHVHIL